MTASLRFNRSFGRRQNKSDASGVPTTEFGPKPGEHRKSSLPAEIDLPSAASAARSAKFGGSFSQPKGGPGEEHLHEGQPADADPSI